MLNFSVVKDYKSSFIWSDKETDNAKGVNKNRYKALQKYNKTVTISGVYCSKYKKTCLTKEKKIMHKEKLIFVAL